MSVFIEPALNSCLFNYLLFIWAMLCIFCFFLNCSILYYIFIMASKKQVFALSVNISHFVYKM